METTGIFTETYPADLETPVGVYLKLADGRTNSFLLESIEGGAARGRYSIVGIDPDLIWRVRDGRVDIDGVPQAVPPLESLRALLRTMRQALPPGLPPMVGGLVGFIGYDMVRQMERLPAAAPDPLGTPDALLLRPALFAVFDHVRDELTLAAPGFDGEAAARARIAAARDRLAGPVPAMAPPTGAALGEITANFSRAAFEAAVERCRDYIAAGDAYQIVPSQRFSARYTASPFALYRALRRVNPAPFLYHLAFDDFAVVGSSPEILVRLRDGVVTVRPLAGTRRRGATAAEDAALEAELLADPKERAEHLMLIDLARHDVGRVAVRGTVRVTERFAIERFSHVMHISSTVQGEARPEVDALAALVAGFPTGTLTGAPKIRAMEIIADMEPHARGIYGGCVGWFGADGSMDTAIALRTAVVKDGAMHVQAGCGVVSDSVAAAEWEETRAKARALFRAAEVSTFDAKSG